MHVVHAVVVMVLHTASLNAVQRAVLHGLCCQHLDSSTSPSTHPHQKAELGGLCVLVSLQRCANPAEPWQLLCVQEEETQPRS